jgi:hypothetical protein
MNINRGKIYRELKRIKNRTLKNGLCMELPLGRKKGRA